MAKCPYCGNELERCDEKRYYCAQCNKYFNVKPASPVQPTTKQKPDTAEPQVNTVAQSESTQNVNSELELLKTRLAVLEAEKQQNRNTKTPIKAKVSGAFTNFASSKAFAWIKKHWIILVASALALIVFITLMTCLVGIRGVYVNVNDPNDFYSFTATGYTGYSEEFGETYVEEGTWKTSGGKITFTVKDEDFGKFSADFQYSVKDGYKTLFIGEVGDDKENMKQYKRVSLVKYDINSKKANVTFDLNGGSGNISNQKIKIGEKVKEPSEKPVRTEREFRGWYIEPYGYKNGGTRLDEDSRIWEDITYYANWYNPTQYTISISGEYSDSIIAYENDNLMQKLQIPDDGYTYEYYLDGIQIDDKTYMPDSNISVEVKNKRGKQYIAYFDADGGSFNIQSQQFTYGSDYTLPKTLPTHINDKLFIGWQSDNETYSPAQSLIPPHNNLYFKALWIDRVVYTVKGNYCEFTKLNDKSTTDYTILSYYNELPVSIIGAEAFEDCSMLTGITIPDSITSISKNAFTGCSSLTGINIPDSVTNINDSAFAGCDSLMYISVNVNNPNYSSRDGVIYNKEKTQIIYVPKSIRGKITIPDSITNIKEYTFENCSLTEITIPDSVTSIGSGAFAGCTNITEATIPAFAMKYIPKSNLQTVVITSGESITDNSFYGCYSLENISIPDSVTSIGNNAFEHCHSLKNIIIPDSVTNIGECAFWECHDLASITIPDGITEFNRCLFANCYSLKSINIPDSVTTIGKDAFSRCDSLTSITIPGSVTTIGEYAFSSCGLTGINIPDSVKSLGTGAFQHCDKITNLTIPGSIKYTRWYAFAYCTALTDVIINYGVAEITDHLFEGCSALTSITIPDSITEIGIQAFFKCDNLQYNIYNNAKYLGNSNNPYLALIEATDKSITSCSIQQNTKVIASEAFRNSALTSITYNGTTAQWKAIKKNTWWCLNTPTITIYCTNGNLDKYDNNKTN